MKKCIQCGAIMENENETCLECGTKLGPALTEEEVQHLKKAFLERATKVEEKADFFYVSKQDKIVSVLLLCGVVMHMLLLYTIKQVETENYRLLVYIIMIWMTVEAFNVVNPKITWKIYQMRFSLKPTEPKELHAAEIALHLRRGIAFVTLFAGGSFLIFRVLHLFI
ncbi:MAG: hypothetical protein H6Q59_1985 [Firmicutes bacterium]|nr:hypothetical protein [Bacillota bacterium]